MWLRTRNCSARSGSKRAWQARRISRSTSETTTLIAPSASACAPASIRSDAASGHAERWIDPVCHHDQHASAANGRNGANKRCNTDRDAASAWCAEQARASPPPRAAFHQFHIVVAIPPEKRLDMLDRLAKRRGRKRKCAAFPIVCSISLRVRRVRVSPGWSGGWAVSLVETWWRFPVVVLIWKPGGAAWTEWARARSIRGPCGCSMRIAAFNGDAGGRMTCRGGYPMRARDGAGFVAGRRGPAAWGRAIRADGLHQSRECVRGKRDEGARNGTSARGGRQ